MHSRVFYSCIVVQHFNPMHSFVQCAVIGHSSGRHCADDGKLLRGILPGGLRWANCTHIRRPRLGDGIGKRDKKGTRIDFTTCMEGEGGDKKSLRWNLWSKEKYKWRRQVGILDLGKYSLWLWLGPSQIQVMTGHILSGALYFRHFPIRISCPSCTQPSLFCHAGRPSIHILVLVVHSLIVTS